MENIEISLMTQQIFYIALLHQNKQPQESDKVPEVQIGDFLLSLPFGSAKVS